MSGLTTDRVFQVVDRMIQTSPDLGRRIALVEKLKSLDQLAKRERPLAAVFRRLLVASGYV